MADHLRTELVLDALQTALWQRRPPAGTVHHANHGPQYTSWGVRAAAPRAGLLGSTGTVGDTGGTLDNSVAESFFATLQTELLDRHSWPTLDRPRIGDLRLDRGLLQPATAALGPRLPQHGGLRSRRRAAADAAQY